MLYQAGQITRSQLKKIAQEQQMKKDRKTLSSFINTATFKNKSLKDFISQQNNFYQKFDEWLSHFLQKRGFDFEALEKSKTKKDMSSKTKSQDNAAKEQAVLFKPSTNENGDSQA